MTSSRITGQNVDEIVNQMEKKDFDKIGASLTRWNGYVFSYDPKGETKQWSLIKLNWFQVLARKLGLAYKNTTTKKVLVPLQSALKEGHAEAAKKENIREILRAVWNDNHPKGGGGPPATTPPASSPAPISGETHTFEERLKAMNEQLSREIATVVREITLPQPVDDMLVMSDIYDWSQTKMQGVLEGTIKADSPLHLQAAQFIAATNASQETREDEIIGGVFVGNYDALRATDPEKGDNPKGFTRIISVTRQDPSVSNEFYEAKVPESIAREVVEVADEEAAWKELEGNFEKLFKMIDSARLEGNPILIHCSQGQSRSVTVMLAYLINRCGLSYEDALKYVKTKRFLAEPIEGLERRLRAYATDRQAVT